MVQEVLSLSPTGSYDGTVPLSAWVRRRLRGTA